MENPTKPDPNAGIPKPPDWDEKQTTPPVEPPAETTPAVQQSQPLTPSKKIELKNWQDALMALPTKFKELQVEDKRATIELGFAMQIIKGNSALQTCDPRSIYDAVIYSARIGITLNPANGLAYLVPRKGKCCLDVGYKGWRATLVSYGAIQHIDGYVVYEDETFDWRPDFNELTHKPVMAKTEDEQKKRTIHCAYARAVLPTGLVVFEVIPAWELDKIKKVSSAVAAGKYSPYTDWNSEMTRKAPIKRLAKKLQVLQDDDRVRAMFENEQNNDKLNEKRNVAPDWEITDAEVIP